MSRNASIAPYRSFDPPTLAALREVFDAAWHDLCSSNASFTHLRADVLRERLANTIMMLAATGERNPAVLRRRALLSLKAMEHLN